MLGRGVLNLMTSFIEWLVCDKSHEYQRYQRSHVRKFAGGGKKEETVLRRVSSMKGNQGQYSLSIKQQRHTKGPAQLISVRHSVTKTGIAQHG